MMIIVLEQGMNVEALQTKYPIIDWEIYTKGARKYWKIIRVGNHTEVYQFFDDMLKAFDREDLVKMWSLVKEKFTSTEPTEDKEREIWVELKRLFVPDIDDELWKLQKHIHVNLTWKLYDSCGVHHVFTEDGIDIYMLVEKEYPLSRGTLTLMLVAKLLVEQDSEMLRELLRKIFMQSDFPAYGNECNWKSIDAIDVRTVGGDSPKSPLQISIEAIEETLDKVYVTMDVFGNKHFEAFWSDKRQAHEEGAIEERARDYHANSMPAVEILDDDIYLGAENNFNLFTVRKSSEGATDEERGRLEVVGEYHLGEFVNRFRHSSLMMRLPDSDVGQIPTIIFGTVNGVIGVIASLPQDQYLFMEKLQTNLRKVIKGVGGLNHEQWRSFYSQKKTVDSRNFLDGDLIESFLDLGRSRMEEISKTMNVSVEELMKRVEELIRLHLQTTQPVFKQACL
ncbi:DNA damage-binding protein 1 isoform X2 [Tanacetum coccineum]|uniref:DNA damage-binding protein 1 isoform X2 n=1 Tax=Tanacetum coccineum TaxID=301880 RepID=A0ABQ5IAT5_9ASTR